MDLYDLGLSETIKKEYEKNDSNFHLGRVVVENRKVYKVMTEKGEVAARVSGKMSYSASTISDYPKVGDWVLLDRDHDTEGDAIIHGVLTRKSTFSRGVAGNKSDEQTVATNIDKVFICMAFGHDYNLRRLERYMSIAWDSGAIPVVILTKSDLCDNLASHVLEVESIVLGVEVFAVNCLTGEGANLIRSNIKPRETVAFIGSSGVGKSTLINLLLEEEKMTVNTVRKDEKGRHTTSHREMIVLPSGGIVIDTPGMREIQVFHADLNTSFEDISDIAKRCKYSDCRHDEEPHCAVKQAVEEGILSSDRLLSYKKLFKELEYSKDREEMNSKIAEKKKIIRMMGSLDATKKMTHQKK
ncbi:MAG: ribosome small subunit-dependent GTPase A [Clostridiales bacterium]|nr:ribosome small subunit-dependent GTPase A [Clostridiales bacterium]